MYDILIVFVHLIVTVVRLIKPGGLRAVVDESALTRHQILILNRGRKRAPNLRDSDRIIAGLCTLLMHPSRVLLAEVIDHLKLVLIHPAGDRDQHEPEWIQGQAAERRHGERTASAEPRYLCQPPPDRTLIGITSNAGGQKLVPVFRIWGHDLSPC